MVIPIVTTVSDHNRVYDTMTSTHCSIINPCRLSSGGSQWVLGNEIHHNNNNDNNYKDLGSWTMAFTSAGGQLYLMKIQGAHHCGHPLDRLSLPTLEAAEQQGHENTSCE